MEKHTQTHTHTPTHTQTSFQTKFSLISHFNSLTIQIQTNAERKHLAGRSPNEISNSLRPLSQWGSTISCIYLLTTLSTVRRLLPFQKHQIVWQIGFEHLQKNFVFQPQFRILWEKERHKMGKRGWQPWNNIIGTTNPALKHSHTALKSGPLWPNCIFHWNPNHKWMSHF